MISKLLVANRGEIALRIIRACRELGIPSVAVYSTADRDGPVTRLADEAVHIGPPPARQSYLHMPSIIEAAQLTGADAIHPGYGFLSEDPDFAEVCEEKGITLVGPRPEVMELLGNKAKARAVMARAGLPTLPGTLEPVVTAGEGQLIADEIGYPVIIKAVAGGGGRGMAVVHDRRDFRGTFTAVRAAAQTAFRDNSVYLERFLTNARHVEIQVLCDSYGNGIHLGERDCSVQRRQQKLIEETPSSRVSPRLRAQIGEAAVSAALRAGYSGAGTVEFLVDDSGFYFMEMNARIQVEHPVTEMATGVDLVQEQIRIASGERLSRTQDDIKIGGAAIECRINAEDPERGFAPTPGLVEVFELPGGPWTRVDTACATGQVVSPHYDSLIAKLIVWAPDRDAALARMDRALAEFRIAGRGLATTVGFHRQILRHPVFRRGEHAIDFVDRVITEGRS